MELIVKILKRNVFICLFSCAVWFIACSDNSTSVDDAAEKPVDTFDAAVCPAEGFNNYNEPNRGTFTDIRDGQVYKYTTIGTQVWMAENLKFDAPYSLCYERTEGFCEKFGKFYSLKEDGESYGFWDQALLDTICPAGWHVPSIEEWNVLIYNTGGFDYAALRLRTSDYFGENFVQGTDDCGFTALPAGAWLLDGSLDLENITPIFWTSTAYDLNIAYAYVISATTPIYARFGSPKMSIRCIKD